MTSYTVSTAKHATLAAGVVDTVTLGQDFNNVEVANHGAAAIYFTTEGATPTVAGDNTYQVAPGGALVVQPASGGNTVVKLISSGATAYSVTGF